MNKEKQKDETMRNSLSHTHHVGSLLLECINLLGKRAISHDVSKFSEKEWGPHSKHAAEVKSMEFGSDEYWAALNKLKYAVDAHCAANPHHPEYYENGINDMSLIDLLEMTCDWISSIERQKNSSLDKSFDINRERYGISPQLEKIIRNTIRQLGW